VELWSRPPRWRLACSTARLGYNYRRRFCDSPSSSRGLGRSPFKAEIAGSNPAGGTLQRLILTRRANPGTYFQHQRRLVAGPDLPHTSAA